MSNREANGASASVPFPVNDAALSVPTAGDYTLQFRYANGGSKDRPLELRTNGQILPPNVPFQPTGGWSAWKIVAVPVKLVAGVNTIRLSAVGLSGPNIDLLTVVPVGR